ncbi:M48 family metalloprotease [Alphaproteobacteria bacterium]|nr:M48 family metalloprotease [Alphaproteobacteria bacterium]
MPNIRTLLLIQHIKLHINRLILILLVIFIINSKDLNAQNLGLIQDAEIELNIRKWIEPIFKVANINSKSVKIYIINDNSINAFVAGGQNIFINTGLILKAKEVNALIGVLAHEIGHIAGGHLNRTTNSMKDARSTVTIATIITAGLMAASKAAGLKTSGIGKLATLGPVIAERNFYKNSRQNEKYADAAALKYMLAVRRSPIPLARLLKGLGKQELLHENRQDPYLRSHPISQSRINYLMEGSKNKNIESFYNSKLDEIKYKRMVAKIIAFTNRPGKTLLLYPKSNQNIDAKYARAIAYLRLPDLDKGIKEINNLINNNNQDPYFPELLGQMLFENGQIYESIGALQKAADILPNNPIILLSLSRAQIELSEESENNKAIDNLKNILQNMPENIAAWKLLSIAEARNNNIGLAQLASAESYYLLGEYELAIKFANKSRISLIKKSPRDIRALDIIFFSKKNINKLRSTENIK